MQLIQHPLASAGADEFVAHFPDDVIDDPEVDSGDVAGHLQRSGARQRGNQQPNLARALEKAADSRLRRIGGEIAQASRVSSSAMSEEIEGGERRERELRTRELRIKRRI